MQFGRGLAALTMAAAAAWPALAGPRPAPRHPDLTGDWTTASLTDLERPDDFKTLVVSEAEAAKFERTHRGKPPAGADDDADKAIGAAQSKWWETNVGMTRIRGQVRTSWIIDPADGQRPLTDAARASRKARREVMKLAPDNPETRPQSEQCLEPGAAAPLIMGGYNDNYALVQTPDRLVIYAEWMHDTRIVRIGEAAHPPPALRVAGGDSIGRWEGDALVVETTNFTPAEVLAPDGDPAADMRIVERFTRLSPNEILYAFSVTNPARFSRTWRAETVLHPANGRIYEFACHEGNYGLFNMLAAARRLEGRIVDGVAAGPR
jgi:hypothetical protein